MVARYMLPTLKKQLILYPLVIILFTLLAQLFYSFGWLQLAEAGIFSSLSGFMFYFAPASLGRRDNRFIIAQLPVRTSEKIAFLIVYYWIVIGLLTMGLYKALTMLIAIFYPTAIMEAEETLASLTGLIGNKLIYLIITGYVAGIAIQIFALYGAVKSKTNRTIMGIVYGFGSYVGMCVLSGIVGMFMAAFSIWEYKSNYGSTADPVFDPEEFAAVFITEALPGILLVVTLALCIVAAVLLFKTYKIIKHSGF